jgi:hypothetical protein
MNKPMTGPHGHAEESVVTSRREQDDAIRLHESREDAMRKKYPRFFGRADEWESTLDATFAKGAKHKEGN